MSRLSSISSGNLLKAFVCCGLLACLLLLPGCGGGGSAQATPGESNSSAAAERPASSSSHESSVTASQSSNHASASADNNFSSLSDHSSSLSSNTASLSSRTASLSSNTSRVANASLGSISSAAISRAAASSPSVSSRAASLSSLASSLSSGRASSSAATSAAAPDLAAGASIYAEKCSTCHGAIGTGRIALLNCKSCGSITALRDVISASMPLEQPKSCQGSCALDTAGFIYSLQKIAPASHFNLRDLQLLDWLGTYRKAANNLAGRLPTDAEISAITAGGEEAMDSALDNLMDEPQFYQRLRDIFNDRWLVRKYQNGASAALAEIKLEDYPNRDWFESAGYSDAQRREARSKVNLALAEESLALAEYIVRNNRAFTEIVTANYTMVTYSMARSYGVEGSVNFTDPTDAYEWQPAVIPGFAHSGVLSQPIFLSRHPTSETNKGRHRAYIVYLEFLDTDILATSRQPLTAASEAGDNPTLNDANCTLCHNTIDPVAQLFSNFQGGNSFKPDLPQFADMLDAGIAGKAMPDSYDKKRLQWLGQQIAKDKRFARATLRTLYKGISGHDTLSSPESGDPKGLAAYAAQREVFASIEKTFINSNYNLKSLIKSLIKSPYMRAVGLNGGVADPSLYDTSSTAQLLTPEMLDRKITAVLGQPWKRIAAEGEVLAAGTKHMLTNPAYLRDIYGGINSSDITERNKDSNGLMVAVQARMANQMSCVSVANDFYLAKNKRKLFPLVEINTLPYDSNGVDIAANQSAINHNIIYLQQRLLGKVDAELTAQLYDLFNKVRAMGLKRIAADASAKVLASQCQVRVDPQTDILLAGNKQIVNDEQYTLRSWMAVLRFLLNDYAFLYE